MEELKLKLCTAAPRALARTEWELPIPAAAAGKNPYRSSEVAVTLTAKRDTELRDRAEWLTVPGFYYEEHRLVGAGADPTGAAPAFRFRVTFPVEGTWLLTVTVAVDGLVCETVQDTVTVAQATAPSPLLSIEPMARQMFCTADGTPVLLSGLNMERTYGTENMRQALTDMMARQKAYGANYLYISSGSSFPDLHDGPWRRRQDLSAVWDALFEAAEENGTYIHMGLMCRKEMWNTFEQHVWSQIQSDPLAFLTDESTRAAVKDYLRYAVARWGYSHRLLSWDLSENVDCTRATNLGKMALTDAWIKEMVTYLRVIDPVHLVSAGVMYPSVMPAIYEPFDFISLRQNCYFGVGQLAEMQKFTRRSLKKTALLMCTGMEGATKAIGRGSLREDLATYHLQNWAGVMAGNAGTAMSQDWPEAVQFDAFRELPVLLDFAKDIPWADPARTPMGVSAAELSHGRMGLQGYRGKDYAYLWIFDIRYVPAFTQAEIPFAESSVAFAMPAGSYRVRCVDTRTGATVKEETVVCDGTLRVTLPTWSKDIAVAVTAE